MMLAATLMGMFAVLMSGASSASSSSSRLPLLVKGAPSAGRTPINSPRGKRNQSFGTLYESSDAVMIEAGRRGSFRRNRREVHLAGYERRLQKSNPICKGTSLGPGESLNSNEFICYGRLRFGVDYRGRFMLGLAANNTNLLPETLAWQAHPTTLFVDSSRRFSYITLSASGNIVGYDENNIQIYDSNLDYYNNRIESKKDDSVLGFSASCSDLDDMPQGELCVELTSPPMPGFPMGTVTWGVRVDTSTIVPFDPPRTKGPTKPPTLQPSSAPSREPPPQTIIWGTVWVDEDEDGKMDVGESSLGGFNVELYECSDDGDALSLVNSMTTDSDGWYFFQVPEGRYRAYFQIDSDRYEFTSGKDTDVDDKKDSIGWTSCSSSTTDHAVQWNAGLYDHDASSDESATFSTAEKSPKAKSSMGGTIFLDNNENGTMDSSEMAVEEGFTVTDALIQVSLLDCNADKMVHSFDVAFPGEYSFDELTEGLYKVEFDIVIIVPNKQNKDSKLPMYSFYDESDDNKSSSFETNCVYLKRDEVNHSMHAGLRTTALKMSTKSSEDIGLSSLADGDMEMFSSSTGNTVLSEEQNVGSGDGQKPFVPALVGVIVAVIVLGVGAFIFAKRRGDSASILQMFSRVSVDEVNSVEPSVKEEESAVSTTQSAPTTAVGSLFVESTNPVIEIDDAESSGESDSSASSDDDVYEEDNEDSRDGSTHSARRRSGVELDHRYQHPYHNIISSLDGSDEYLDSPTHDESQSATQPHSRHQRQRHSDYDDTSAQEEDGGFVYSDDCNDKDAVVVEQPQYYNAHNTSFDNAHYQQQSRPQYPPPYTHVASVSQYTSGQQVFYSNDGQYAGYYDTTSGGYPEYEDSASVSSNRSSDPPAASYQHLSPPLPHFNSQDYWNATEYYQYQPNEHYEGDSGRPSESSSLSDPESSTGWSSSSRSKSAPPSRPAEVWTQDGVSMASHNHVDDESCASDQSSDPPGASYKAIGAMQRRSFTPPPPRSNHFPPPPRRR